MALSDVRTLLKFLAPEFVSTDDTTLNTAIGLAQAELSATRWAEAETTDEVATDTYWNRASALLAAHYLTLRGRQGATAGAIQSEREGDVSVTYAVVASGSALDATGYGQQFQEFRRSIFVGATTVAPSESVT